MLAEAQAARDRLQRQRMKASQKLRKAHGGAMGALAKLQALSASDDAAALREALAGAADHTDGLPALDQAWRRWHASRASSWQRARWRGRRVTYWRQGQQQATLWVAWWSCGTTRFGQQLMAHTYANTWTRDPPSACTSINFKITLQLLHNPFYSYGY